VTEIMVRWARAYCVVCRKYLQCEYSGRKPVGIECTGCREHIPASGYAYYPLTGLENGAALYLDPEKYK
jgi:hypothetical protein